VDDATARPLVALLAAAIFHQGQGWPPETLIADADRFLAWLTPPGPAAHLTLTVEGDPMPLTIDSAGAKAVLEFADREGEPVNPPSGTQATATSSDPAVLAVGPAQAGTDTASGAATIEFPLTPAGAGTATLTVHATDASGNPLLGPDAATPITDAAPVNVTVNPGAAATERFTVPDAAPGPVGGGLGSATAAQGQPGTAPPDAQPPGDPQDAGPALTQQDGQPGQ
jgi:hypothetical protein